MDDRREPADLDPGGIDAAALAAVLDGTGPPAGSDAAARAAHDRAAADVKLLARMIGLIGDSVAESGSDETSGVSAVPGASAGTNRVDIDSGDVGAVSPAARAVVVPLRQRRPFGRVLAAAASLIVVFGLGTAVLTRGGGQSVPESAPAPPAAVSRSPEAPDAAFAPRSRETPDGAAALAAPAPNLRRNATMAAPNLESAPEAKAAPAAPAMAPEAAPAGPEAAPAAPDAAPGASVSARSAPGATPLDQAVACARGILIGRVLSVATDAGGTSLRLRVEEWISPASGPTSISYRIGGLEATTDDGPEKLMVGQRRLFVIPRSSSAPVHDFAGPDFTAARAEVAQAQRQAPGSC